MVGISGCARLADLAGALAAHGDLVHDQVGWRLRAAGSVPHANEVADLVRDTFMVAYGAREALEVWPPAGLQRPWLLTIARNECLRALEVPGRVRWPHAPGLVPAADLGDRRHERHPGGGLGARDLRTLVRWAADGLGRRDREVVELGLRHGLPAEEVGRVVGIAGAAAARALEDLDHRFVRVLGTLLLARSVWPARRLAGDATGSCVRLGDLTLRWDGVPGDDWRRRLLRHADGCATCSDERARRVDPVGVLCLPALDAAPPAVCRWILADATDPSLAAERAALAARAGPFGADAFPVPLDGEGRPCARGRPTYRTDFRGRIVRRTLRCR